MRVEDDSRHDQVNQRECDELHPHARDFLLRVFGRHAQVEALAQPRAEALTEQLTGLYLGSSTKISPRLRQAARDRAGMALAYVRGDDLETVAKNIPRSVGLPDFNLDIIAWRLQDLDDRSKGTLLRAVIRPYVEYEPPPRSLAEKVSEPETREPSIPVYNTTPEQRSVLWFLNFLPEEQANPSNDDVGRLFRWIHAAAAVWAARNRDVELSVSAGRGELDDIFRIGELALERVVKTILIPEAGIQAMYIHHSNMEKEDLVEYGMIGGLRAVAYYTYREGGNFRTYARSFIKGAMRHAIRDEADAIRLPRRVYESVHALRQAQLDQGPGTTPEQLAETLKTDTQEVRELLELQGRQIFSFDAMLFEPEVGAPELQTSAKKNDALGHFLEQLDPLEAYIVSRRFGLPVENGEGGDAPLTIVEIAKDVRLSASRVGVLYRQAIQKLRKYEIT